MNTSSVLNIPSILGQNILINGNKNYLVKSYDECENFTVLTVPGISGYTNFYQRLDPQLAFAFSADFNAYDFSIHKSVNDGQSWIKVFDSLGGVFFTHFNFFDDNEGIVLGTFNHMSRTKNGGTTWLSTSHPLTIVTCIRAYDDSLLCIGGGVGGSGDFIISKDRGNTWFNGGDFGGFAGGNPSPTDFFFLNKDTIFGIATSGWDGVPFVKSFNGGLNWQYSIMALPTIKPFGLYAKSKKEIYAVGVTSGTIGVILKSNDLGQSWSTYNTGIKTELTSIQFLNDSIALVAGSNGILFKWNSKQTIFTDLGEESMNFSLSIFPNPVKDKLHLETSFQPFDKLQVSIINTLGQAVVSDRKLNINGEIDLGFLESGVYYLQIENGVDRKVLKLIKE